MKNNYQHGWIRLILLSQMKLLFLISVVPAFSQKTETTITTIFLVRHAEQYKNDDKDPSLTSEGQERANLIRETLSKTPIAAAYATTYKRALESAYPTTKANGIEVTNYKMEDDEEAFINGILKNQKGRNVLLIGHSGNIVELLNAATKSKKFNEKAIEGFSDFYIITFPGDGTGVVTRLKYGK